MLVGADDLELDRDAGVEVLDLLLFKVGPGVEYQAVPAGDEAPLGE
jgi:hypothetical protein